VDLAQVAGTLAAAAQANHPNLLVRAETAGSAQVVADPRRAAQVGELLLANACQAARSRVTIHTAVHPETGAVEWTITDDGPGIAPEQAERLFSPFFTTRAGHAGLGLALAQKLVELHGGRISAGNLPAGGFQARASFPAG
jgi:signal transduction histidine kinase